MRFELMISCLLDRRFNQLSHKAATFHYAIKHDCITNLSEWTFLDEDATGRDEVGRERSAQTLLNGEHSDGVVVLLDVVVDVQRHFANLTARFYTQHIKTSCNEG